MFVYAFMLASQIAAVRCAFPAGVIATGTQGVTNPPVPTMPTTIDQTSMARLLSVNSIDDFCIFAPPSLATIPDTEVCNVVSDMISLVTRFFGAGVDRGSRLVYHAPQQRACDPGWHILWCFISQDGFLCANIRYAGLVS